MKENEKKMIAILVAITLIVIVIFFIRKGASSDKKENEQIDEKVKEEFVEVLEDGTRVNTSSKLSEKKTINGVEISNIQLSENNGLTVLSATATNVSSEEKRIGSVDLIILDKTGAEITRVNTYLMKLGAGESVQINASATFDYANAYDFKIEEK